MKVKLLTCVNSDCDYVGLDQVYRAWEDAGYVERVHIPLARDRRHIAWVGRVGGLALEPSNVLAIGTEYEYVLACQYNSRWHRMPKVLPWNFYPRDWPQYRQARLEMPPARAVKSIFSGTIRGRGMGAARNQWIGSTEVFSHRPARRYRHTNHLYPTLKDYYIALGGAKFALCPVGDCPICQRESETLGMGCVGMYTPGVEWRYAVSPVENRDFITIKDVEDMHRKMDALSDTDIREMSMNGMKWFDRACTPDALWQSVKRTIDEKGIRVDSSS